MSTTIYLMPEPETNVEKIRRALRIHNDCIAAGSGGVWVEAVREATGLSESVFYRGWNMLQAATENPEKYGDLLALIDATTISTAHAEFCRRRGDAPTKRERNRPPRHAIHGRAPRIDPVKILNETASMLDGILSVISLIEPGTVDVEIVNDSIDRIRPSLRHIHQHLNTLVKETNQP